MAVEAAEERFRSGYLIALKSTKLSSARPRRGSGVISSDCSTKAAPGSGIVTAVLKRRPAPWCLAGVHLTTSSRDRLARLPREFTETEEGLWTLGRTGHFQAPNPLTFDRYLTIFDFVLLRGHLAGPLGAPTHTARAGRRSGPRSLTARVVQYRSESLRMN